jgi:hypothetical protein
MRLKAIAEDVRSHVLGSNAVWFSEGPPMFRRSALLAAWIFLVSSLAYSLTLKMEAKRPCTYTDLNDVTTQKFVTCITRNFISPSPHQIMLWCSNQRGWDVGGTNRAWESREINIKSFSERNEVKIFHLESVSIEGRIILKWIFNMKRVDRIHVTESRGHGQIF